MPEKCALRVPDNGPAGVPGSLVERALGGLAELPERPVAEHVEVFDGVHRALQDALATLDSA